MFKKATKVDKNLEKFHQESLVLVGDMVKLGRLNKGLTQKDLSEKLKINQNYISDIENGKKNLTLKIINKIFLELDLKLTVNWTKEPNQFLTNSLDKTL